MDCEKKKETKTSIIANYLLMGLALFSSMATVSANESHDMYRPATDNANSNVFRHTIDSQSLNALRTIDVSVPVNYVETAPHITYPLIVVLDGEFLFNSVAAYAQLQAMNSQMPDTIVVGIPNAVNARRDMTPKPLRKNGEPLWFGGHETQYLSFIQEEVLPLIEKKYRVADFKILIGLSPSANFSLHSFWKQPTLFSGYIAVNSTDFNAVGYDGESAFEKITQSVNQDKGKNKENNERKIKRYLYMSMPKGGTIRNPKILDDYKNLSDELSPYKDKFIDFKWEVIDKQAYAAVLPAIMSGLEFIFPPKEWDPSYRSFVSEEPGKTLNNIKTYFAELNQKYGFSVLPKGERYYNRNRLKRIAYVFIHEKRYSEAEAIINYWLSFYPRSANAYDTLADLFQAQGKTDIELEYRTKALKLAKENHDVRVPLFEESLRALIERSEAP